MLLKIVLGTHVCISFKICSCKCLVCIRCFSASFAICLQMCTCKVQHLLQFFKDQGVVPEAPAVDKVVTNQFIDQINTYNRAGVVAEAKKEDLSKLH